MGIMLKNKGKKEKKDKKCFFHFSIILDCIQDLIQYQA